ncbi:DinB family protein [Jeotgalibacillus sp. ET6]|uniref:DinB family protein n=1 Tax=Jeotgalibacillus sp. ET6 TaxID=3037260 RepID=UPI002418A052|nr:DinB family protein [Jeotgalibacillus sp. ET6]MDG5472220.1 DinB family protein [Jeotgalibacillus sp. ET6]
MAKIDQFMAGWLAHRQALIELVGVIDNDHLPFKPWEEAMSVSVLVQHIADSTSMFVQTVQNGELTPPSGNQTFESITDLQDYLQAATEQTLADLKTLSDEQLDKQVEFYGSVMPGYALLESGKDHEIHHKGQLFTYARLTGAKDLPFFIAR